MKKNLIALIAAMLSGCAVTPEGVKPITGFELDRYLGTWHEIARLDHRFERGLVGVTAEYSMRDDGGVRVLNRGYDQKKGEWKEAVGKAYFTGAKEQGRLKVSFFGPFYGGYNIIALDPDYKYAMVAGPSREYLWILAREPQLDGDIVAKLKAQAWDLNFPAGDLIFPGPAPEGK